MPVKLTKSVRMCQVYCLVTHYTSLSTIKWAGACFACSAWAASDELSVSLSRIAPKMNLRWSGSTLVSEHRKTLGLVKARLQRQGSWSSSNCHPAWHEWSRCNAWDRRWLHWWACRIYAQHPRTCLHTLAMNWCFLTNDWRVYLTVLAYWNRKSHDVKCDIWLTITATEVDGMKTTKCTTAKINRIKI